MTKQPTSFRLSDMTTRQLAELISATGLTQSEVMSQAIDRMHREEIPTMNIRKPDNIHVEFKSLDWQNAVATMRPINAVRLLAKEIQALVEQNCPGETPQHKGRQAELIHNAFVSGAYPHLTGTRHSLLYGAVANKMYNYHSAK